MAEDDIYKSKARYEKIIKNLSLLAVKPENGSRRKYYCKNINNLECFKQMCKIFEVKDTSYIRRIRLFKSLIFIVDSTEKDLKKCEREDVNEIVARGHKTYNTPKTKEDIIRDLKYMWKCLFPEKDEKGRVDETIVPYTVRHLSPKVDKSKQKRRKDRLNIEQLEKLMNFFSRSPMMQFYIALIIESLGRPQELSYLRISDLEIHDNTYAKIYVSEHGKEGTKFLQCIDSYPYLLKWFTVHPFKDNKNAFLFIASGREDNQFTPVNATKQLQKACERLNLPRVTAYSLKRNGVTFARLRGESDVEIQHKAGWTSTKQINTYDQSNAEDVLKNQLAKRGLIKDKNYDMFTPKQKTCLCGENLGFAERICPKCKRLIHQEDIKKQMNADNLTTQVLKKIGEQNKELILKAMAELGVRNV
ncbi:MAG: hypothetical protein Q8R00_03145 [Candidatus Nanoarchaeia archaeon]|nr:hypothetical protein [Candidatus Nanoarchaeia archaeon]